MDSVTDSLLHDSNRKYTIGDIYLFTRWYVSKNDTTQALVKQLVKSGQLEILHGGAVSTDEASPNYHDLIDNMMVTRDWLKHEFGVRPDVAWNLDQFGHSAANAQLMA